MQGRPAEKPTVRRWNGTVAHADELNEFRVWVIWGLGAPPERAADPDRVPPGEEGNEIAEGIAAGEDAEWASAAAGGRWVLLVEGDEADVDAWVEEHTDARGYASYLMEAGNAHSEEGLMRGTLRNDNVRRRRFDAGRPD